MVPTVILMCPLAVALNRRQYDVILTMCLLHNHCFYGSKAAVLMPRARCADGIGSKGHRQFRVSDMRALAQLVGDVSHS